MISRPVIYLICCILAAVAVPMALGLVAPNSSYGFRTPATLASPAVWYRANAFAGWLLIAVAVVVAAVVGLMPHAVMARHSWIPLAVLMGGLIVLVVTSTVYLALTT